MSSKRYTDIHMEKRYTNGHSLKGYFIRLTQEQIDFLKSLPKGDGSSFIRQAINDKISSTVTLESNNKKAVMINSIEEKNKRKINIDRELGQLNESRQQLLSLEGLGFESIRKHSDGANPIITIEQKSIAWNALSAETRRQREREHIRIYGKPRVVGDSDTLQVTCQVVVFQTGEEANTVTVEAGFLSEFRRKNERLDDTARRLYSEYLEQKGMFEITLEKMMLLGDEANKLEEEIKESIEIYKDRRDIQIYNTEPTPEPLKRGGS